MIQRLQTLFQPIAPTVRLYHTGQPPAIPTELQEPENSVGAYVTFWYHVGFGGGDQKIMPYDSQRIRIRPHERWQARPAPEPSSLFFADLGGGVSALVPLALYGDSQGTLPHVAPPPATEPAPTIDVRAKHLATVALAWNIFEHFYPYFDIVPVDWMQVLRESLARARTDVNEDAFLLTLKRLVAKLQDGHGVAQFAGPVTSVLIPNPPWQWIDGHLLLTLDSPTDQLHIGDEVLKINGQAATDLLAQEEEYIAATNARVRRSYAVRYLWMHLPGDSLQLQVRSLSGQVSEVTIAKNLLFPGRRPSKPKAIAELRPGILYFDLTRIGMTEFDNALPQMVQAQGLIFDVRGYPGRIDASALGHFVDGPISGEQFYYPLITYPDHQRMDFKYLSGTTNQLEPRLKAKVAFLADNNALSWAETFLAFAEQYHFGEIVGEPTSGETGGHNPFTLFKSYSFDWTGTKVLKQDGSPHHGIGVLPTIPVTPTIQGIADGRDEILERAIEIVTH